ncbi:MAG: NGG1p interacting factor NIF3, partial [Candidatus Omnitrophota bacterium]
GVSTLICMHLGEEHFKKASEEHMNVIIAGHIASDNIGLNLILDELEKKGRLKILSCSGFRRFTRKK